jgi:hypothetical protein
MHLVGWSLRKLLVVCQKAWWRRSKKKPKQVASLTDVNSKEFGSIRLNIVYHLRNFGSTARGFIDSAPNDSKHSLTSIWSSVGLIPQILPNCHIPSCFLNEWKQAIPGDISSVETWGIINKRKKCFHSHSSAKPEGRTGNTWSHGSCDTTRDL